MEKTMTDNHAQEIGALQADADRTKEDVVRLFDSNARRKKENVDVNLKMNSIQHTVEETNQIAVGVASSMEKLTKAVDEVTIKLTHMDGRITALEGRQFDWPRFLRGLVSPRGLILVAMLCGTVVTMFLAIQDPTVLPLFFEMVGGLL
jgi:hypothetical protein